MKRLYRSDDNKIVAGVFGGVGEYLNVDPVIIRMIAIVVALLTAVIPVLAAYAIALFIIPNHEGVTYRVVEDK